jgi:hypothetical protein
MSDWDGGMRFGLALDMSWFIFGLDDVGSSCFQDRNALGGLVFDLLISLVYLGLWMGMSLAGLVYCWRSDIHQGFLGIFCIL